MTPRWPLTPFTLRSHEQLYPRIIVSNSHKNTSKHADTVTFFSKTLTKGQWPLDDLWPHFCWGHICASTQGSLCPSPMGIHQCMWIQWSILQNLPHTTYTYIHIHTHTHTHTTYRMSDHIVSFLNKVKARQKVPDTGMRVPGNTRTLICVSVLLWKIILPAFRPGLSSLRPTPRGNFVRPVKSYTFKSTLN